MGCEALPIEYYESLDSEKRLFGTKPLHKKTRFFQHRNTLLQILRAQKYYPFFLGVDGKVKVIEKTYEEVPMVYRGKQIGTRKESTSTFSNVNPGTGATTPYTPKR
jgi:hypothetical protein